MAGFLSDHDREFLAGEVDYGDGDKEQNRKNQKRYRIRQNARQAYRDFHTLFNCLDEEDRELVFENVADDQELLDGIRATLAFTYWATSVENSVDFELLLRESIIAAETLGKLRNRTTPTQVDVTVDVERERLTDPDEIRERMEKAPETVTHEEIGVVLRGAVINPTEPVDNEQVDAVLDYLHEERKKLVETKEKAEEGELEPEPVPNLDDLPPEDRLTLEAAREEWGGDDGKENDDKS